MAFVNTSLLDPVTSRFRILIRPSELGMTELGLRAKTMKKNVFLSAVLHVAVAHMRDYVLFRRKVHASRSVRFKLGQCGADNRKYTTNYFCCKSDVWLSVHAEQLDQQCLVQEVFLLRCVGGRLRGRPRTP